MFIAEAQAHMVHVCDQSTVHGQSDCTLRVARPRRGACATTTSLHTRPPRARAGSGTNERQAEGTAASSTATAMKPMTACVSPSAPLLRPHRSLFSSRRAIRLALFLTEILLTSLSAMRAAISLWQVEHVRAFAGGAVSSSVRHLRIADRIV